VGHNKNLSFDFSLYFEGSPPKRRRRSLGSYAVVEILLYFYVPMERLFDGTDQENSKNMKGKNEGTKKKRFFFFCFFCYGWEVPILVCSPLVGNTLRLPPSGEPTRTGTSLTTK
jgi:hypothetical protein